MISFLIKHKKSILIITLAFFLGSIIYIGLDAYHRGSAGQLAAKVGTKKITIRQVDRLADEQAARMRNQGIDTDENIQKLLRQQMLAALVSEEVLNQAAQKAGLSVSDYEMAVDIKRAFGGPNGEFNIEAYVAMLRGSARMTPAEFEEQLRRGKMADRFRQTLFSFYKLTPAEIQYAYKTQHGDLKNFDENKKEFIPQLMDTKMETAQRAFLDEFNQQVEIKTYLQD